MDDFVPLVEQAQTGDEQAYGELVQRFRDMAYGYAYAILKNFQLAEDAAQEAFVDAYRNLPKLAVPRAFPVWLKRIIYKHCDRITRGKRPVLTPLDRAYSVSSSTAGPEEMAERHDLQAQVLEAISALSDRQRAVTALYYINGYSQNEIAAFLDVPTSTVKSRLHTSRQRLRETMIDMIRDALRSNALPESFTEETLTRAVEEAAALNTARQYGEAEELLRDVLVKMSASATDIQVKALKELNRTLIRGQYAEGRFDERWNELAVNGRAILASGCEDEKVYRELANTLMYIPRMPEAIDHIETWIARKGPNPERVGKLAWTKGCMADYAAAQALWAQHLHLAHALAAEMTETDTLIDTVSYTALTLVDCFAAAGLLAQAGSVAEDAWALCQDLGDISLNTSRGDPDWLWIHHMAGLPPGNVAQFLIDKWSLRAGDEAEGLVLCLREWTEPSEALLDDWLAWVERQAVAKNWDVIRWMRGQITRGFHARGLPEARTALSEATWNLLTLAPEAMRVPWQWECFDVWAYLDVGDLEGAARVAERATEAMGPAFGGPLQIQVAAARGASTPSELVRLVEDNGIQAVDSYGMSGWYLVAREAAASGDKATAVNALRRTLSYWTNPPLGFLSLWENDSYWGAVADEPEVLALFAERRARIGPIHGLLHYFPGW